MAQDWYVGIGGKARRIVKAYIGVGGKAREIVSGYLGIGGKARKFWGGGSWKVKGFASGHTERACRVATENGTYALFSIGDDDSGGGAVYAYNASLVQSSAPNTDVVAERVAARAGNYGLFAGGQNNAGYDRDYVRAYSTNLTVTNPEYLMREMRKGGAAEAGTSAVIGFGKYSNIADNRYVNFYTSNLVRSYVTNSDERCDPVCVSTGTHAIFAGGYTLDSRDDIDTATNVISIYASNQTLTSTRLNTTRGDGAGAMAGDYAVIVSGARSNAWMLTSDAINKNTFAVTALSNVPDYIAIGVGVTVKGTAIIGPMENFNEGHMLTYDKNLVMVEATIPDMDNRAYSAASVGNYQLMSTYNNTDKYYGVIAFQ